MTDLLGIQEPEWLHILPLGHPKTGAQRNVCTGNLEYLNRNSMAVPLSEDGLSVPPSRGKSFTGVTDAPIGICDESQVRRKPLVVCTTVEKSPDWNTHSNSEM